MRKDFRNLAAIFVLLFFANLSWAQGTITFDTCSGYPKCDKGQTIAVQCIVTPDCGWSIACGAMATITVWEDCGPLSTQDITAAGATIRGAIDSLKATTSYSVTVEVTLVNGCDTATIKTAFATVTTK